ncbi:hypothetical protein MHD_09730 [Mannheimia granulomatis]|uniref:Dithiobiotin synthetase n=1 Tax=Mannheimia granulomatis TaxID=85402 RepID=A0A011NDA6_9PAST|nr:pimeloyl-ACP methyl esterase BioG family protein [Mannheimia granulomatis]EXI62415.1 hypothetical protein AK33_03945 [Mannheimia granulomatis]RGE47531.1 hypothetical protein MHD_09730 [Mannheimia granulomatis]
MKTAFFPSTFPRSSNLVVYVAGWGTPLAAVEHLALPENHDLLICYDYQDLQLDFQFSDYDCIHLVAWSMGVWVANQVMPPIPLASATAINGTALPYDDKFGIPKAVFKGTLESLNEANRIKFEHRMCHDKTLFEHYQNLPKPRPLAEIQQELAALYQLINDEQEPKTLAWTHAIIGTQDRIFPTANQLAYWQTFSPQTNICTLEGGHYLLPYFHNWEKLWKK